MSINLKRSPILQLMLGLFMLVAATSKAQFLPDNAEVRLQIRDFQGNMIYDSMYGKSRKKSKEDSWLGNSDVMLKAGNSLRFYIWAKPEYPSIGDTERVLPTKFKVYLGSYALKTAEEPISYFLGDDTLVVDFPALVREVNQEIDEPKVNHAELFLSEQPLLELPLTILRKPFQLSLAYAPKNADDDEKEYVQWEPYSSVKLPEVYLAERSFSTRKKLAIALSLILATLLFALAIRKYGILYARPINHEIKNDRPVYSLGKAQSIAWLYVVFCTTVFIWINAGVILSLNDSILILLGISLSTSAAARFVDTFEVQKVDKMVQSNGFIKDLLNDDHGKQIQLHRFQSVMWNLLFLAYFVVKVIKDESFPVIELNWLVLMGISNSAYLVLKTKEKPKEDASGETPSTPPAPSPEPTPESKP